MHKSSDLLGLAKMECEKILEKLDTKDKRKISVVVVGSASIGLADKHSDVDGKIICWEKLKLKPVTAIVGGHKINFEITTIDEFCINPLILKNDWSVSPFGLFAAANAVILHDPERKFSKIQDIVRKYYPKKILKQHILNAWRSLLEDGRYNLDRDIKRGKVFMTHLHASNALWHSIMLCFYLNKSYYPTHHQWLYDRFILLPKLSKELRPHIDRMMKTTDIEAKQMIIAKIIDILRLYVKKNRIIENRYLDKWWLIPWR
jgi:hypothetical protein